MFSQRAIDEVIQYRRHPPNEQGRARATVPLRRPPMLPNQLTFEALPSRLHAAPLVLTRPNWPSIEVGILRAYDTCCIADSRHELAPPPGRRAKVQTSVTSCGSVRLPETTWPLAMSTRVSRSKYRIATVA